MYSFLYFGMIQLTLKDFATYHAHKPWYGKSVMNVLDGIIINDYATDTQQKILSILAHTVQWKKFILEKLKDNEAFSIQIDSEQDWPVIENDDQGQLEALKTECKNIHTEILKILEKGVDFSESVDGKYSKKFMVLGLMQHDICHIGQIALLVK